MTEVGYLSSSWSNKIKDKHKLRRKPTENYLEAHRRTAADAATVPLGSTGLPAAISFRPFYTSWTTARTPTPTDEHSSHTSQYFCPIYITNAADKVVYVKSNKRVERPPPKPLTTCTSLTPKPQWWLARTCVAEKWGRNSLRSCEKVGTGH
ncbi:hypothetical protein BDQ17DRAFT_1480939 [Cyathus striatus]|nr:hypothetical protein BDQ17DRAFT_1480939 [Cyathus striatus]